MQTLFSVQFNIFLHEISVIFRRRSTWRKIQRFHNLKYIKKHHHDLRNIAKTAEFAIAYGGNGSTIAKNTGCSKKQGEAVYNQYFESFSGMKDYFSKMLNKTLANGYIEYNTITNRKFLLDPKNPIMQCKEIGAIPPDLEKDYESAVAEIQRLSQNYPIQGELLPCLNSVNSVNPEA
jgi:DNA polymerase I-like protein with 3'-5' exonuclease and polymerase domains